jgi:NADPH-dependent curcumin reductase
MTMNKQWLLASRPTGWPTEANFRLVETAIPTADDGEIVVRNHFMSLDPYMRGRMDDGKSYAQPQPLDQVMQGGSVGEVIESRSPKFAVGDKVRGGLGWQQYGKAKAELFVKITETRVPLSAYLGVLGMPGVTAWMGLSQIIEPKAGETLVVSAASGAVGGVVGQLAKAKGCHVVGIAGGAMKCKLVVEEFGFDTCVDYKAADFREKFKNATPKGVDGYFENVGGEVLDTVFGRMNAFGRVAVCGLIAGYNEAAAPMTQFRAILINRLKVQGFIVSERMDLWPQALQELAGLVVSGNLKYRETVAQGIEAAPRAFLGLLKGENVGKQVVKLI